METPRQCTQQELSVEQQKRIQRLKTRKRRRRCSNTTFVTQAAVFLSPALFLLAFFKAFATSKKLTSALHGPFQVPTGALRTAKVGMLVGRRAKSVGECALISYSSKKRHVQGSRTTLRHMVVNKMPVIIDNFYLLEEHWHRHRRTSLWLFSIPARKAPISARCVILAHGISSRDDHDALVRIWSGLTSDDRVPRS